jgi:NAD kinase
LYTKTYSSTTTTNYQPVPGFGTGIQLNNNNNTTNTTNNDNTPLYNPKTTTTIPPPPADLSDPDLIVTLGGDGTIMHAAHVFSGPVPPILPVAGGSMGFLTPFAREEILDAILIALGIQQQQQQPPLFRQDVATATIDDTEDGRMENNDTVNGLTLSNRAINNMLVEDITRESYAEKPSLAFGRNSQICISMRMRLDCRIFGSDGTLRSRYNVLNEVVIDRGSSPYLASLECFCDDVHLTTVQADGIM